MLITSPHYHPQDWGDGDVETPVVAGVGDRDTGRPWHLGRWRPAVAWLGLLVAGFSIALTGPLDWNGLYAEYLVEFLALNAAGWLIYTMGLRSSAEGFTATLTAVWTFVALWCVPMGRDWYWPAEAALHLLLCCQLAAWYDEARRMRASEAYPVLVMMLGMLAETLTLAAKLALPAPDIAACPPGALWLTCYTPEPWHAFILPGLITLAMLPWWCRRG